MKAVTVPATQWQKFTTLNSLLLRFIKLLRQLKSNLPVTVRERIYSEKNNINRVIDFFVEHYNSEYSLEDLQR